MSDDSTLKNVTQCLHKTKTIQLWKQSYTQISNCQIPEMVNGNYVVYGDKPSSESEIVHDHVHTVTLERKLKRKTNRSANELQQSLNNLTLLDNETDSAKYEKKIKEPKLLRYVPTSDVEENFVTEKFETYDLKPTEEQPRRYGFTKKPRNPSDGSVNYAYSRSSSSSPNNNLPTIREHCEQFDTYRVKSLASKGSGVISPSYETKLDKYFTKPRETKTFRHKVNYNGSHPDSLYRVSSGSGVGAGKMVRVMRALRWPTALLVVCAALALFVYFLMPDNFDSDTDNVNSTFWETSAAIAGAPILSKAADSASITTTIKTPDTTSLSTTSSRSGTTKIKTPEIDFYEADSETNMGVISIIDAIAANEVNRKLPAAPVYPSHLTPEVQYGNEKADTEKARTPKILDGIDERNRLPEDSTLKPHITQKPEKPLAIYFKDALVTIANPETIVRAETINEFSKKQKVVLDDKHYPNQYKVTEDSTETDEPSTISIQEYYGRRPSNVDATFTSGHSKFFGIGIEDAEKMKVTTQSPLYHTRVSPTLPPWRERDDSTTKHYPVNLYSDAPQCHSPRLPMCRGVLPYDLAGQAPTLNGVEITNYMTELEYLVSTNCSERARQFVCALLEPECNPPPFPPKRPCYSLCKAVTDNCDAYIPQQLIPAFRCKQYDHNNCLQARAPCSKRELACDDGTCIPSEWVCDGNKDCSGGEDEMKCDNCEKNQFRCPNGACILKNWLCDGYLDCSDGEDENAETCQREGIKRQPSAGDEPGEESAGSAPAPSIRRPNKVPEERHRSAVEDSSKELLITSDSSNALKRNYTRRPSTARLTPYRPKVRLTPQPYFRHNEDASGEQTTPSVQKVTPKSRTMKPGIETEKKDSSEDINLEDINFFDDLEKETKKPDSPKHVAPMPEEVPKTMPGQAPKRKIPMNEDLTEVAKPFIPTVKIDKNTNKFERHFDGAAQLRKAKEEHEREAARLRSITTPEEFPDERPSRSSHASPCPSGELRCVDGLCIALAQLCDGTIDCSDHADEDNCYT